MKPYEIKYWYNINVGGFASPRLFKTDYVKAINREHANNIAKDNMMLLRQSNSAITHSTVVKMSMEKAAIIFK